MGGAEMKNYEPIEQQHMQNSHRGAVIFWLSVVFCIWLAI